MPTACRCPTSPAQSTPQSSSGWPLRGTVASPRAAPACPTGPCQTRGRPAGAEVWGWSNVWKTCRGARPVLAIRMEDSRCGGAGLAKCMEDLQAWKCGACQQKGGLTDRRLCRGCTRQRRAFAQGVDVTKAGVQRLVVPSVSSKTHMRRFLPYQSSPPPPRELRRACIARSADAAFPFPPTPPPLHTPCFPATAPAPAAPHCRPCAAARQTRGTGPPVPPAAPARLASASQTAQGTLYRQGPGCTTGRSRGRAPAYRHPWGGTPPAPPRGATGTSCSSR
eukprot:355898-Chlamydomonas_euryale.AAC.2